MSKARVTAKTYMDKAERALASARMLLQAKDNDGACNRAYYAMFDAAHLALRALAPGVAEGGIKTHSGLIGLFGEHVVQPRHTPPEFGRALNRVEHFREVADYSGDPVSPEDAKWAVEQAAAFVAAVRARFLA